MKFIIKVILQLTIYCLILKWSYELGATELPHPDHTVFVLLIIIPITCWMYKIHENNKRYKPRKRRRCSK